MSGCPPFSPICFVPYDTMCVDQSARPRPALDAAMPTKSSSTALDPARSFSKSLDCGDVSTGESLGSKKLDLVVLVVQRSGFEAGGSGNCAERNVLVVQRLGFRSRWIPISETIFKRFCSGGSSRVLDPDMCRPRSAAFMSWIPQGGMFQKIEGSFVLDLLASVWDPADSLS